MLGLSTPAPLEASASALPDAIRRAARGSSPRLALLLHLSSIAAPRGHHARIAHVVLTDVAQRLEGEVWRLPGGDLALLCRPDGGAERFGPAARGPQGLPAVLDRLFATTVPWGGGTFFGAAPNLGAPTQPLYRMWHLPHESAELLAHLAQAALKPRTPAPVAIKSVGIVSALLDFTSAPELMRRQTALRLRGTKSDRRMEPWFETVGLSEEVLEQRIATPQGEALDQDVFRHFAVGLKNRGLEALSRQIAAEASRGVKARGLGPGSNEALPLHVRLSLPGVDTLAFDTLADACLAQGRPLGVGLSYVEACEAPRQFTAVRTRLERIGATLILEDVGVAALRMTRPGSLGADLVKIDWSDGVAEMPGVDEALAKIGHARIVLQRSDDQAAFAWGLRHGITAFQGLHIDLLIGASRLRGCATASGCTRRQCADRAGSFNRSGQAGCHQPALLKAGCMAALQI